MNFKLESKFKPAGDQPQAIKELWAGLVQKKSDQVLLGATGTGKTFTIAHVIEKFQRPTLVLSHNKTLAAQLYSELKSLFPNNNVEYFISNFDYYRPKLTYLPQTLTSKKLPKVTGTLKWCEWVRSTRYWLAKTQL